MDLSCVDIWDLSCNSYAFVPLLILDGHINSRIRSIDGVEVIIN